MIQFPKNKPQKSVNFCGLFFAVQENFLLDKDPLAIGFFDPAGPEKDSGTAQKHDRPDGQISPLGVNQFTVDILRREKIHDTADHIAEDGNKDIGAEI